MPVTDSAAILSASTIIDIAWDVSLFAEVVELSVSDNTGVSADGVTFIIAHGPRCPLRISVNSAWLGHCERESIAVLVSCVDTLVVAKVGSSVDSLSSALPNLIIAIFELWTVAISNELPFRVFTVDCGNNFTIIFLGIGAKVFSSSCCSLFQTTLNDVGPVGPGVELVAAWERDVGLAGDDRILALTLCIASLGAALLVVVWAAACLVVNEAIVLKRCVLVFDDFS